MSYYPILTAPYCSGKTTLYNFPPNNWERFKKIDRYISLTYIKNQKWYSQTLHSLKYLEQKTITYDDIASLIPNKTMPLLSLSAKQLPQESTTLPTPLIEKTITPNNRATLEVYTQYSSTSYQGEIDPFPPMASLLTIAPFIQFGSNVENYLLLINIEKEAKTRVSVVKIYDAKSRSLSNTIKVKNNNINVIPLDRLGFCISDLPVITCDTMAAIPLYFSCSNDGQFLSMEHTHPPSSLVIHGNRFAVQKEIKKRWNLRLKHASNT